MKRKIVAYTVVTEVTSRDLAMAVNDLLIAGWEPLDGAKHFESDLGRRFMQTMVKVTYPI